MNHRKLWIALVVIVASFAVLGGVGYRIARTAPPIPQQVITADGRVIIDSGQIQRGQGVWQSLGGQEVGSIRGHGAYPAPDWAADWLHREAVFIPDRWAQQADGPNFNALTAEQQAALRARLEAVMRTNKYDQN